jgi:hypothetical protein
MAATTATIITAAAVNFVIGLLMIILLISGLRGRSFRIALSLLLVEGTEAVQTAVLYLFN